MTQLTFDDAAELEEWRDVVGYEGVYQVSSLGRVWSQPRSTTRGGLLKLNPDPRGYLQVTLSQGGKSSTRKVHTLVAAAFIGGRPPGLQIRHLDGKQTNNLATNLKYGTGRENSQDAISHGTHTNVRKTHCPKGHPYDEANTISFRGHRQCRTCYEEFMRTRRNEYARAARARKRAAQPSTITQTCPVCGKDFERSRRKANGTRRVYCSPPCVAEARRRAASARKSAARMPDVA